MLGLETPTTSCKSSQSMQELPTSHTSCKPSQSTQQLTTPHTSHQSSHTNPSVKFSPKSNIPPTLPYTRHYKYKVKKSLHKKEDECCAVLGMLGKK